jgi:DNA-binding Lrp family transcriptional regulator
MEFNKELFNMIKKFSDSAKEIKNSKEKILNKINELNSDDYIENMDVFLEPLVDIEETLKLVDIIIEIEPDENLRELYYQYNDYLDQEEYILCKEKLEEIKNYQKIN